MTAQFSDTVRYNNFEYSICGVSGEGLFHPKDVGLKPVMISTACWRGFYCTYEIAEERFKLNKFYVGLEEGDQLRAKIDKAKKVFGKSPVWVKSEYCFLYENLDAPVDFSGGLLLGKDFIRELYVHMGFHPAYKYRDVYEVIVKNGHVISIEDKSAQMQEIRETFDPKEMQPSSNSKEDIAAWVKSAFSLDY